MRAGPRPGRLAALAAALCLALPGARPARGQTAEQVVVDGAPRSVPVLERQGRRFVALDEVARLLGGRVEPVDQERVRLVVGADSLLVLRRVPYVRWDGRWYQTAEAPQKDRSGFWLPAESLRHLLPTLLPGRFPAAGPETPATPASEPARPADERPPPRPGGVDSGMIGDLEGVDLWVQPGRTRLDFRLARSPHVEVDATLPGALQVDLDGVSLPADVARGLTGIGLVDSVSVDPRDDGTGLTLWVSRGASLYSVASLESPAGLEVVLLSAPPEETVRMVAADAGRRTSTGREATTRRRKPEPEPGPADRAAASPVPSPPGGRKAWKVVLDAGHGGHDPGAHGPDGTEEKDVTLAIVKALAGRLRRTDRIDVVLTRSDDTFVPLGERTRIANREKADLFVSIHANSAKNHSAEGFETYFLSAAKTEDARRVARMENAAIRYEDPSIDPESLDDLNFILWDLAQNEYLRESSTLAETVQEDLRRRLSLKSRGVKQAPFYVLNGAFMPAILFETAFISNPREEELLNDPAFRTRLVDGLAESILEYLDQYGRKAVAPPSVAR